MNDVRAYLSQKGIDYTVRGEQAIANCPFCDDREKKFAISLESGAFNCYHLNKCGAKGSFREFQRRFGDAAEIVYKPKVFKKPVRVENPLSDRAMEWFTGRGITAATLEKFKVSVKDGVLVFPMFKHGKLVNNKYRTHSKEFWQEKEAEQILYGHDLIWPELKELVIVEGEIDEMTMVQLGIEHTVSVPSGAKNYDWIENEYEWLERFDKIYLGLDADDAGDEGAEAIAERIGRWRCFRVRWPEKDPNDCLKKGMTKDEMMDCILNAEAMGPTNVKRAEEFFAQILEPDAPSISSGFPTFDAILGGFRPCEVTVWTGRNGDGKTTILGQVTLAFLLREYKVCIGSFEMRPKQYLRWMMQQCKLSIDANGVEDFGKVTAGNLVLLDVQEEITPDVLMEAFEFVARRIGAKMYIIDSMLRVDIGSGADWLERQRAFMNRLTGFALKYGAHVHLVAHPRKGASDKERVDKVDISGSYDISNLASNVVSMRRVDHDAVDVRYDAQLTVLKNRELGKLGCVDLTFDAGTKVFREYT